MENIVEFVAGPDDEGRRLDRVLRILLPGLPLSAVYGALRKKRIRVNGRKASPDDRLAEGDRIAVDRSIAGRAEMGTKA
ncbi:MAG: RluA family pseudouridine synthase, partial [Spirochaetaceae bacterium]|nr:RluA family pseudouridine synthase [Spirochaetaceae bacterium]